MPGNVSRKDFATHLAQRTLAEYADDRCSQFAASISYHVVFSLFPLAIVLAAVFGIVVRTAGARDEIVSQIAGNLPLSPGGEQQVRQLLEGATGDLSTLGLIGVVGLVWSASGMMAALRTALNEAWDVEDPRPFLRGKLVDVGLVLAATVGALASVGVTIFFRAVGHSARGSAAQALGSGWLDVLLSVVAPLAFAFVVALALYRLVPAADVRFRHAWPVALAVAALAVLLQNGFALYVRSFADYNAIYGTLGAVVALMFFVYLLAVVLLLGAEVASEWPRAVEAFARGDVQEGPPFGQQVRDFLSGLWVRRRQGEAEQERPRAGSG